MSNLGLEGQVGFAFERSGAFPGPASYFIHALSESLTSTIERYDVANIIGAIHEPTNVAGLRRIAGSMTFAAEPINAALFVNAITTTDSLNIVLSGGVYEHICYTANNEEFDSNFSLLPMTFEISRAVPNTDGNLSSSQQYSGCCVSALTLNVVPNQEVRFTADIIGVSEAVTSTTSPIYPTSPTQPFAFDTCSVSIDGKAIENLEALTISVDNQLEGIPTLNESNEVRGVRRTGPQLVRVAGTMTFDSLQEYDRYINQDSLDMYVNFFLPASFGMQIHMPDVVYSAFPLGIPGRERITVDFEGIARYDETSEYAIQWKITNYVGFVVSIPDPPT